MKKNVLIVICLFLTMMMQAQVLKTINTTAGSLASGLTSAEKTTVTNLTITGSIDARDFKTMRDDMPLLSVLDISGVNISAYSGAEGTSSGSVNYAVNAIPVFAFCYFSTAKGKISLTSVILPSTLISFENFAFRGCTGIISLKIPSTVSQIGASAFYGCKGLSEISIPTSVFNIGLYAFADCNAILSVEKSNSNYCSVDGILFDKAQSTLIQCPTYKTGVYVIPSTVTSIGEFAFYHCNSLTSVTFPSSLLSINGSAFKECINITSLTFPASVNSFGFGAFVGCSGSIQVDPGNLFFSSFEGVLFNKNQTTLIHCPISKVGTYKIPSSVTAIEYGAFWNCSGLTSLYANSTYPIDLSSTYYVFLNVNKADCKLYVPSGSRALYAAASQWSEFPNIVEFSTTCIDLINTEKISLYPNPTTDGFRVSGLKENTMLNIFDLNGKLLLSKKIVDNEFISVGSLPQGVSIVRISSESGILEKKLVKK